jgi:hypothetical protein
VNDVGSSQASGVCTVDLEELLKVAWAFCDEEIIQCSPKGKKVINFMRYTTHVDLHHTTELITE